ITHLWLTPGETAEILLQRIAYGDDIGITGPEDQNLRGRPVRSYDSSGVSKVIAVDFKGNLLESERQLATTYDDIVDWSDLATDTTLSALDTDATTLLETEVFSETREYDAINRPTSVIGPDLSETLPVYNEAGLLESVSVKVRGA